MISLGSEKLKVNPNKVELVEVVTNCLERIGRFLKKVGGGGIVKNEGLHKSSEDMGELSGDCSRGYAHL